VLFRSDEETVDQNAPTPENLSLVQSPPLLQPEKPYIPERLIDTPPSAEKEVQPESRIARRARQKQMEAEDSDTVSSPEERLLKEANELTSRVAQRARYAVESTGEPRTPRSEPAPAVVPDADIELSPAEATPEPVRRYRAEYRESLTSSKGSQHKKMPVTAAVLLWMMVAAALFIGFFFFNRYVQTSFGGYAPFIRELTNGKVDLAPGTSGSHDVTVTPRVTQTDNGVPAHAFDVTASGASSVRILPIGNTFSVTDGKATFTVPDEAIARALGVVTYDNTVKAEGLNLDVVYGTTTLNYPIDPFEITLIGSEYKRESPEQTQSTISSDVVSVSLTVSSDASVYINNKNFTDNISDDGRLSVEIPLESSGDNIFAVDVIQPGRQAVKDNFTVTQQAEKTLLQPETNYLRTYTDSFECRGKTDPGATLSAQLNGKTFAGLVSDSGAYSVACTATEFGLYAVALTASGSGKSDNVVEVSVERLPEATAFKQAAQNKTAADIIKQASKLMGTGIKLTAKISEVSTDEVTQKFSVSSGNSKLSCYYNGQTPKLSDGQEYVMYGMTDEAGSFYVMYID
jgi:hypothetical protein